MFRILLFVAWGLGVGHVIALAIASASAQPWLIAAVWGLPIGWVVAWWIRRMDPLVDNDQPSLLHFLMIVSEDERVGMHGFDALVAQAIAAIVILCGTIAANRLGYDFPWDCGLITLGVCMLAQYFDLHLQSNTTSTDTGCSAGPDGTF